MSEKIFSEPVELPDGRKVRVLAYEDGSVRFRVDGTPYWLEEAFLTGSQGHAILKLTPRRAADVSEGGATDPLDRLEQMVEELLAGVRSYPEEPGEHRILKRHERKGMADALVFVQQMMKTARSGDQD